MRKYIINRVLLTVPMLFVITFISFLLISLIPSDPAEVALRVNEVIPTPEAIENMRIELGLDKPFLTRYLYWIKDVIHLDFGASYINNNRLVFDEIKRTLPVTIKLSALSFIIVILISFPVGILSAVYKNKFFDKITRIFVFIFTAIPNYWLGLLLMWIFALKLKLLPTGGATSFKHFILPAITISITYISTYVRLIRNSMLENMKENYVFYAKVRGIKENTIILKHVLLNSLHSTITSLGMSFVQLIAGTFVIENIFSIPGIGRLCITAIFNRDYPIIQAYILMMGCLFVFCNLFVDILQMLIDPRLKEKR